MIEDAKGDPRVDSDCLKNVEKQWGVTSKNVKHQVSSCIDKQYNDLVEKAAKSCVR